MVVRIAGVVCILSRMEDVITRGLIMILIVFAGIPRSGSSRFSMVDLDFSSSHIRKLISRSENRRRARLKSKANYFVGKNQVLKVPAPVLLPMKKKGTLSMKVLRGLERNSVLKIELPGDIKEEVEVKGSAIRKLVEMRDDFAGISVGEKFRFSSDDQVIELEVVS